MRAFSSTVCFILIAHALADASITGHRADATTAATGIQAAPGVNTTAYPAQGADHSTDKTSGEMLSATTRLFNTLLVTFAAVFLGLACVRLGVISPGKGDMKGLGFLVGQIVFPLLIFKTVATARLGSVNFGVLAACTLGKVVTMAITWLATFFFYKAHRPLGDKFLTATVFSAYVISSNDFAVGFPVVDALYGEKVNMGIYITGNSLVGATFFVPLLTILFSIGVGLKQQAEDISDSADSRRGNKCLQIIRSIMLNPVILMTIAALLYKTIFGFTLVDDGMKLSMPHPLSDLLTLVTSPFGMCALFLTGTSLGTPQVTLTPILLVIMKVIVCAYATYAFGSLLIGSGVNLATTFKNFTFLYGMIPTSSAPLIFCAQYAPEASGLMATSILIGLVLAGPMMYSAALFLESANLDMAANLANVALTTTVVSVICGVVIFLLIACMCRAWDFGDTQKMLLFGYALILLVYEALMIAISPQLGNMGCEEFNERNGWSTMAILICGFQNAARFIFMSMQIRLFMSYRASSSSRDCRGMLMLIVSLAMGFVLGLLVFPNTLREICSVDGTGSALQHTGVWPNAVWSIILLVCTITLLAMALARRNKGRALGAELPSRKSMESPRLDSVVKPLAILFILRYFVQVINCGKVLLGSDIKGSFAEMLVVENIMEHGQLIVLLVILINNSAFSMHVGTVLERMFPWLRKQQSSSPKSRRLTRMGSVFPDQVFDHHLSSVSERASDAGDEKSSDEGHVMDTADSEADTNTDSSSAA